MLTAAPDLPSPLVSLPAADQSGQLSAAEELVTVTFDQVPVGIAVVAPDGRWLRMNHRLCDIVGYNAEELSRLTFQDITHPDDLAGDLDRVNDLLSGRISGYSLEKRYIRKDGDIIWTNLTVSLVRHTDGSPNYFISVIEDIQGRKQAESEALCNAGRLRELARVVERLAEVRQIEPLLEIVRQAARHLTGSDGVTLALRDGDNCIFMEEDAIGPLWKGRAFPVSECAAGWVITHNQPAVIEDVFADPRVNHEACRATFVKSLAIVPVGRDTAKAAISCSWAKNYRATGDEVALQQALADAMAVGLSNIELYKEMADARQQAERSASEAHRSAATLRERETLLRLFVEHAPASLAMFDSHMRYLAVSRRWMSDYGLNDVDLIGLNHYEIFPEIGEEWKAIHRRALAGEIIRHDEDRFERADGSVQWLRWEVRPWYSNDGEIGGIVVFSEDITRYREAQQEIHRLNADLERRVLERTAELSAANTELESFAYAVSHDLRAPLRAMGGFSRALIEDYGDQLKGEAKVYLDQIEIAARNMGRLIDGILTLSRSTRGDLQRDPLDISAMAQRILAQLAVDSPGRKVEWRVEPGIAATGDSRMVEAVLDNLIGNAWKYTSTTAKPFIHVSGAELGGQAGVCIADNGAGFDMAYAERLFKPFQRLHRQEEFPGLGIGLATVQRIIRRHGGEIRADGRPGAGATFCFTLSPHAGQETP